MQEINNILAILDNYLHDNPDEIAKEMAESKCREIYEEVIGALGIVPSKAGKMWWSNQKH